MAFACFAGGSCSFRTGCGSAEGTYLQCERLLRQWEHGFVLSVHHSVIFFVLCKRNPCNGSFVKSSECGSACRYATRHGSGGV